ncbi:uncharacterized protein I206_104891 [Kwoniella pini CBS 10737]|uniref:CAP-Gly domain-containing protein n=1 Tax=Kwoniella pini CBS 10737 TaxID=1296096 RepID=A0A1B9I894_9TREE|nr:uncharacterized protein I206_02431 [Kwoniella pini CBS 10737]OCF51716.1 hypothetical protein I206_02431 [Kwoniella pini CBS 10737]
MIESDYIQPEAGPSNSPYVIGNRYLNSKTNYPLTLRYIGPLPPPSSSSSSTTNEQIWLGAEYDNLKNGKGHNGIYKDIQVFITKEKGSASFLKYSKESLKKGNSLIDSIENRYGKIINNIINEQEDDLDLDSNSKLLISIKKEEEENLILGSSENSIIVKVPNLLSVKKKISKLEKIKNIGFEEEYINSLGGNYEIKLILKQRMKNLKWLNLSKNLLSNWEQLLEIVDHFDGLETLTLNHSRIQSISPILPSEQKLKYISTFRRIKELHLSDCLLSWEEISALLPLFPNLEVLHLDANRRLSTLSILEDGLSSLRELRLAGCPLTRWEDIIPALVVFPKLEILDLSLTPLDSIPSSQIKLDSLKSLVLIELSIAKWSDLDNLSNQLPNLNNLRFSVSPRPASNENSLDDQIKNDFTAIDDKSLRSICIAKFPNLIYFNSNIITKTERRDSELFYISFINKYISKNEGNGKDWGKWEELIKLYNITQDEEGIEKKLKIGLKGKMLNLKVYTSLEDYKEFKEISILPLAKISLLQKKLIKLFGLPINQWKIIQIWNTKKVNEQQQLEEFKLINVNKITNLWEDKECGWWFEDGDDIFVEFISLDD